MGVQTNNSQIILNKPVYCTGKLRSAPWTEKRPCPRCRKKLLPIGYCGAISRQDNETELCSDCGFDEALQELSMYNFKKW